MKINVHHIAKLANLSLTETETKTFEKQLGDVLQYIEKLNELDTKNVKETSQVTGLENITRIDEPTPSLPQDAALSNAPAKTKGNFQVPGILITEN